MLQKVGDKQYSVPYLACNTCMSPTLHASGGDMALRPPPKRRPCNTLHISIKVSIRASIYLYMSG